MYIYIYISQCAARRSRHRATHKVCHRISFLKLEEHFLVDVGLILVTFGDPGASILVILVSWRLPWAPRAWQSHPDGFRQEKAT